MLEHHHCKVSTMGPEASEVIQTGGGDIPKPLTCQHLTLPRTVYWVTATHELPVLLRLHLQSDIRTTHWNQYYSFCLSFSFSRQMVSNLSWQVLFFNLIIFMGDVEIHFPLLGCICRGLLIRKLV